MTSLTEKLEMYLEKNELRNELNKMTYLYSSLALQSEEISLQQRVEVSKHLQIILVISELCDDLDHLKVS